MLLSFEAFKSFVPVKPTYALFGWPLGHTMSPQLHASLFEMSKTDADYIAVAVPPEHLQEALTLAKKTLQGLNITIPHKQAIIPFLDEIDAVARDLRSVNTISFTGGKTKGYNTDIHGFASSLTRDEIKISQKKLLLIGYGGAAAVIGYHALQSGAELFITGRNLEKAEGMVTSLRQAFPKGKLTVCNFRNIPRDIEVVVNATPLGMYPNEKSCPLRFLPPRTKYVFDAIYNPPITSIMKLANRRKTKTRDGLYMLVMQAAHAQMIWTDCSFDVSAYDTILKRLYAQMAIKRLHEKHQKQNLVLCGFMGAGKTTAGRKLARLMQFRFIDADQYLQEQEGQTIAEIFEKQGEEYFRKLETQYLQALSLESGIVLALGGGAVLREENVHIVKESGLLINLDTPFHRIVQNLSYSNHRPLLQKGDRNMQIRKLYNARKQIYLRVADISVRSPRLSELIDHVIKSI